MITHIVLFRLNDPAGPDGDELVGRLRALPTAIPEIRHYEVGRDVVRSDRSWDVGIVSRFDSLDDLEAYRAHPAHQDVVALIREVTAATAVVDYES